MSGLVQRVIVQSKGTSKNTSRLGLRMLLLGTGVLWLPHFPVTPVTQSSTTGWPPAGSAVACVPQVVGETCYRFSFLLAFPRFPLLTAESAAAEPTSAAHSPCTPGGSPSTGTPSAAEQHPDQRDHRWGGSWHGGHGGRAAAQPGLRPKPGASKQEATAWALGCQLRRARHALGLPGAPKHVLPSAHVSCKMGNRL